MKKTIAIILGLCFSIITFAQSPSPVHIKYNVEKIAPKTYEVHLILTIEEGWHTYSQFTAEGGATPTLIEFTKNPLIILKGKTEEIGELHQYHDKTFDVDVKEYSDKIEFVQKVILKANAKTNIKGSITYQACTNEKCLPPKKVEFNLKLE